MTGPRLPDLADLTPVGREFVAAYLASLRELYAPCRDLPPVLDEFVFLADLFSGLAAWTEEDP